MILTEYYTIYETMRDVVKKKAKEAGMSLKDYLAGTGKRYCIIKAARLGTMMFLSWDNKWDYICYDSYEEAQADLEDNEEENVVTETFAIKMLSKFAQLYYNQ